MSNLEQHLADTAQQVQQRLGMGDEVQTPRELDHLFVVARKRADALAADLEATGFEITGRSGFLKTTLEATRTDAVDATTAATCTREVVGIADRHDATYDGWGGMAITDDGPVGDREDSMDPDQVDVAREQEGLREAYSSALEGGGCPGDLARELGRGVKLEVYPDGWSITNGSASHTYFTRYSPSEAREAMEDMADMVVAMEQEERRPRW